MLIYFLSFVVCVSLADDSLVRIEEKLTTDRDFYDQWMNLVDVQAAQFEEQQADFPLGFVMDELSECHRARGESQQMADALKPADIAIYAEMGHLSTFCWSNKTTLQAGLLDSCIHKSSTMSLPSLDKMLRWWNPNLTVVESNERDDLLSEQGRHLAERIRNIPGQENLWKLIVILPSIQDGEASETGQTAVEVLTTIEELHRLIPQKTMIVVLRQSNSGIWRDASHAHKACHQMLSRWKGHNKVNSKSVWDQVEIIVKKNFQRANFSVELLPLLKNAALANLPDGVDLSVLGYDCAHFSERGLSLLHLALWNSLVTRNPERSHDFRPIPSAVRCPDPRCPFFRTETNSAYCIWSEEEAEETSIAPHLIVAGVLLLTVLLTLLILICVCKRPNRTVDFLNPVKAFGASFSSIKFIDEDV